MKIFDFFMEKLGFLDEDEESEFEVSLETGENAEAITEVLQHSTIKRADINVLDYRERELYVRGKCETMKTAAMDIERQKQEYQVVTERLADLDEIASIPRNNYGELIRNAKKIEKIEEDEENYVRPKSKITDAQYREMERLGDETPKIIEKIRKEEEHQMVIKRDMNLLEGEKGALAYQRREDKAKATTSKMLVFVFVFVSLMATLLLLVLQITLHFDVKLGYYIVFAFLCVSLLILCVTYKNAIDSEARVERKINKAISLQNSVKIKYVNSTNLIDYYYSKYHVNNSYELNYMWDKYLEEKAARNHSEEVAHNLEIARKDLANVLRNYKISDVSLFVYNPYLITDEDALSDARKNLIIQRQKLKKGIDFNTYSLEIAKDEIEDLVKEFPKYSNEILAIVSQYEESI